ncbi:MAG: DUF4878 domain-containing protein [Bacteroidales bacterium]|nr:DUF4878 domain-containing protein [Bacteroidales bacterium]
MRKMKTLMLAMLAALSLSFASCASKGGDTQTPESAAKTFVTAFYTADFDELYKSTAKSNRPIIQQLQKHMNDHPDKLQQMRKNEIVINDVKCEMQNDSVAECKCQFLYNQKKQTATYNMRKEDGTWRVDLTIKY